MSTEKDPPLPIEAPLDSSSQTTELHSIVKPAVDRLAREIRNALHGEQYTEAIAKWSTPSVNDLSRLTAELVELRVQAFEKRGDTKNELKDALFLIHLDPQNLNGYLRAAKLYSIQGKPEKAIEILKSGISVCSTIEQQRLLQQKLSQAQDRQRSRVDFIARVPYDILCNILGHLTFTRTSVECILEHILACTRVSSVWRKKLLQCPVPWRSIHLTQHFIGTKFFREREQTTVRMINSTISLLPLISRHIQLVKLDLPPERVAKFLQALVFYKFSSLQSLIIDRHYYSATANKNNKNTTYQLYAALPHVSQTLTVLDLSDFDVSLGRILDTCPNLTTIRIMADHVTGTCEDYPLIRTTSLIVLRVEFNRNTLTASEIVPILQHSPGLKCLRLHCVEEEVIAAVAQHCLGLKTLETTTDDNINVDYDSYVNSIRVNDGSKGLDVLWLKRVSARSLQNLLESGVDNLRHLYLGAVTVQVPIDWTPFSRYAFRSLVSLTITEVSSCSSEFMKQIPVILRSSPALQSLQMRNSRPYDIGDTRESLTIQAIFDAIPKLRHLRCLVLTGFDIRSPTFDHVLDGYAAQGSRCRLEELDLTNIGGTTMTNLDRISRITSLETLRITLPNGIKVPAMTEFLRRISQLPELYSLYLNGYCELTMEAAQYLIHSRKLEELDTLNVVMSPEVKAFFESSSNIDLNDYS